MQDTNKPLETPKELIVRSVHSFIISPNTIQFRLNGKRTAIMRDDFLIWILERDKVSEKKATKYAKDYIYECSLDRLKLEADVIAFLS